MKSVLISIQPYWVFLIIAEKMGWTVGKLKTVEVRKSRPTDKNWNKIVKIYCSKNQKSFYRIPKRYQPFMQQFLGKVVGEFVCDRVISGFWIPPFSEHLKRQSCLSYDEANAYANGKPLFAWHISNLIIYDKPSEFWFYRKAIDCGRGEDYEACIGCSRCEIKKPPQSWCYIMGPY